MAESLTGTAPAPGLVAAMGRAYRRPRAEMARQLAAGLSETRAMAHLFIGCALAFLASLPNAIRAARGLEIDSPLAGTVAAHLFGYFFVAPLLFYGAAALTHLLARVFGGRGGFLAARSALFWGLLLGGPIALALSVLGMINEAADGKLLPLISVLGYAGLGFWVWLFSASLAEAEGFSSTARVAAVLVAAFVAVVIGLTMLTHAGPVAG